MGRVVHFEIHADDPERAVKFYGDLFGWTFSKYGDFPYWLVTTGPKEEPGIDGGLQPREGGTGDRINGFVCVVDVLDIDKAMARAEQLGAPQTAPKQPVPGIGWSAYYKDPEGNTFGLFQNDPAAA
jgi:predicted enzyme related to lactoylglutathione lyase